jgi:hypothetical protein
LFCPKMHLWMSSSPTILLDEQFSILLNSNINSDKSKQKLLYRATPDTCPATHPRSG